jgi:hypothetical protein
LPGAHQIIVTARSGSNTAEEHDVTGMAAAPRDNAEP